MVYTILFSLVIGLCVGSFLNAAIFRIKEGVSVARGRSKCTTCEEPIDAKDLIPVLSYLRLKGRCRKCKSVISWQYPAVEAVTALLFAVAVLRVEYIWAQGGVDDLFFYLWVLRDWIFIAFLVIIFVYDLRHMLILDKFTVPAMIIAVLTNLWLGLVPAGSMLLGALALAAFFHLQYVVSKGTWVGGGDIRMGALMGFMLGLQHAMVALFLAYVLGAVISMFLLWSKKVDRKTAIPFGTFLSVATVVVLFAGDWIIWWYLGLFS